MRNLLNCIRFINNYKRIINPIVCQKLSEYYSYTNRVKVPSAKSNALRSLKSAKFDSAVSSVCSLYPGIDVKLATEVIFSFLAIVQYLKTICDHSPVCTEPFLRLIFSSLKDAVNIRSDSYEKYFTFFPSKDDDGYLSILVEKCRQKVLQLPSYNIVRDSIVAYLALFIDLQIIKYSSDDNGKEINLLSWSSAHMQAYSDISGWEFCMAVDSTLSIQLLLALATNPDLTEEAAETMSNSFFPWICGIQKILEGYLNYNNDLDSGCINYLFYYSNLKEYQDRIIYFIDKSISIKSSDTGYYRSVLKILLSLYITHPLANEGMNKITSKALYDAGGKGMPVYVAAAKFIGVNRI